MTENEQLRKEMNELRERVAVLESQRRPPPAPVSGGGGGSPLSPFGGGLTIADAARRKQAQDEEQRRRLMAWQTPADLVAEQLRKHQDASRVSNRYTGWNKPQPSSLGSEATAQGLSSDGHLGLLVGALNTQMPNLGDVQVNNPGVRHGVYRSYGPGAEKELMACGCGSPDCTPFIPPEGGNQA